MLRRLKLPHVFALLTMVVLFCSFLTYLVPSGSYQRETKNVNGRDRSVLVADSYSQIPKHFSLKGLIIGDSAEGKSTPVSVHGFLSAIPRGLESTADIIFFIFIIGGVLGILQATGTVLASIQKLLDHFGKSGPMLTILLMVILGIGGSTLGMGEEFIPLVPIFLIVSKRLGYDRIYGMAIVIIAAQVGFAAATTNPFTVVIAQGIAELPLNSGMWFRMIFFAAAITVTLVHMLRYGAKIKKDPSASYMADDDFELDADSVEKTQFTKQHFWILFSSLTIFGFILYAVQTMGWWMADMAGGFFLMGIIAAIIGKLTPNQAARAFVKGMEEMVVAALVVGFAKGIQVVLDDGQILDTLIYSAASVLQDVPQIIAVQGMLLFQTCLNFFIPSGSGQAAVTMPLMAPLGDVLGITRQTAVFAFQCGDGFSNLIIPTSGILMSMLSLAKIPYGTWMRFMLPLFLQLIALSAIFLAIAVAIGYN